MNLPPMKNNNPTHLPTAEEFAKLAVKDIKALLTGDVVNPALVDFCRADHRVSVQKLAQSYDKKQAKLKAEFERLQNM